MLYILPNREQSIILTRFQEQPSVTPEKLLNGYEKFNGLKKLVEKRTNKPIYVIFAQCYGLWFADRLIQYWQPMPEHVIVIGISSVNTASDGHSLNARHLEARMLLNALFRREKLLSNNVM